MACLCGKQRGKGEAGSTNPVYGIQKTLVKANLKKGIRFDKIEEVKYMYDRFNWTGDEIQSYDAERKVIDDDTRSTHMLRLTKSPDLPWGFIDDWYDKVVLPRKFNGGEVIGFYIDQNKDFHFKVFVTD